MSSINDSYRSFTGAESEPVVALAAVPDTKVKASLNALRGDVIGGYNKFTTPFGKKAIIYADWTASGRPVDKIEKYLLNEVMPFYGNTHTATSVTGHQSSCFRNEARQIVAESVNAKVTGKAAEDVVIFAGNGTTAAVNKLVDALGLNIPFPVGQDQTRRPVVFVSSYEHHSNLLPWRESIADVVTIAYDAVTGVCLDDLRRQLELHADRVMKIGAFSAASNVTGLCAAVDDVCILLHQHNALAAFDYATAAPYVKIDMNPVLHNNPLSALAYKDAIYFSGHKFLGGPGCPGVLVVKSRIMPQSYESPSSASVGGGTVFYVTEHHHRYLSNREEREEGGTPYVLGDVKLGLVMSLKQSVRAAWIEQEEFRISQYAQAKLQAHPAVLLLGKTASGASATGGTGKYLPIFSFLLRCGEKFLHFHFVAALLNDLFGVQCRGGCMCAGPFAQTLLGLTDSMNQAFEQALLNRHEVLRPGFTRLSFPYWMSHSEIDYIVDAVLFVAEHGWKFLPAYRYNHMTGEWAHTTRLTRFPERKWLSNFNLSTYAESTDAALPESLAGGAPVRAALQQWGVNSTDEILAQMRSEVQAELKKLDAALLKAQQKQGGQVRAAATSAVAAADGENLQSFESLRWFVSADEAAAAHSLGNSSVGLSTLKGPIQPVQLHDLSETAAGAVPAGGQANKAASAFAAKRDQKFLAHTGNEEVLPRYLTLKTDHNAHIAAAVSIVQPVIKKMEVEAPAVILAKAAAPETAVVVDASAEVTDEFTCTTGTCSFRQRENIVEGAETGAIGNGKILSGPGRTYNISEVPGEVAAGALKANGKPKPLFHMPSKKIMKAVGQAVRDWNMIEEGDRLLLGLSGGKDSLALLHILIAIQKRAPVKFEIACATVDPQTDSFDPSPLIPYVQSLGITYHYLSEPIVELAKSKLQGDSLCAFCSRFKRGLLYSCCRNNKYNKLVLAQHLDDLVESFMMSALHNGQVRTMKANYTIEAGDVRVIRPLIYVRELMTRDFSQASKLPIINENCPACFEQPKERARMKKLMAQEETMVPNLFYNLKRALMPLLADETYAAMDVVARQIEANNNNPRNRTAAGKRAAASADAAGLLGDGQEVAKEGEVAKRAKTDTSGTEAMEEDDGAGEEPQQDSQVCGANGGYCPPCYELA